MKQVFRYSILIGLTTNDGVRVPAKNVIELVSMAVPGFSVIKQTGYWQGQKEKSLCFTIIGPDSEGPKLETLCKELQIVYKQDSVYLTQEQITLFDINASYVPRETYNSKVKA